MDQEETYKPTPADQALYTGLITTKLVGAIQQAHVDGKMDQDTYNQLFKVAREADSEVRKLLAMLEQAPKEQTLRQCPYCGQHHPASQIEQCPLKKSEEEVNKTIKALLEQLPASYPPYIFSKSDRGYWLEIERTIIFRRASAEEAIKHTKNYVEARKASPNLPIGVIYGIYD